MGRGGRTNKWTNKRTNKRTNERKSPCVLQDFVPFGAAAQKVAKASDGQRYPLPLCEYMWMCDSERGSGPEGADDLYLVSFEALILASMLKF